MKRAFTLIEINLAILAMAGGILSIVILFSLGYRENRQNQEDMVSAAYADAVFGPIAGALGDANCKWSEFNAIKTKPTNGWSDYLNDDGTVKDVTPDVSQFRSYGVEVPSSKAGKYGLIVQHEEDSPIIRLGFRFSGKRQGLLTAPLYYTEVRFQGKYDN